MTSTSDTPAHGGHRLAKILEANDIHEFGFVLFRMDFTNDEQWVRFVEEFENRLVKSLDQVDTGIQEKLCMNIVDDEVNDGAGPIGVASSYQMLKEEGEVEAGLDTKMCLYADSECIASLLQPESSKDGASSQSFVKAVDVDLASKMQAHSSTQRPEMRVAVESLLLDFYPALRETQDLSELTTVGDSIWQ